MGLILASLRKVFFIQFLWVFSAHAGPLEVLSKGAYLATGNRCQSYDKKSAQKGVTTAVCYDTKLPTQGLTDIADFLEADAEDQLFARLAQQQTVELRCAEQYANTVYSGRFNSKLIEGIQAKLDIARIAKQKLSEASQKLATDPDISSRVCPLDIASLEAETPVQLREVKNYQLCKEIIINRQAFQATVSSIPLSGVSNVREFIEKYTNSKDKFSKKQLEDAYGLAARALNEGAQKITSGLATEGAEALKRSDRHALLQDPALAEQVLKQIPIEQREDVRGLLCQADARYGKGSDSLDAGVMVTSLAFSGGVGIWARAGGFGKAALLAEQGRKAGVMTFSSMRTLSTLQAVAVGADVLAGVIAVDRACQDQMLPDLKTAGACTSAPSVEKTDQENCILMSTLSAMGFASVVPDKIWKTLGTKVSDSSMALTSGIKKVSKETDAQSLIWAAKARGDVAEASRLENQLIETLKHQEIVDARPIGNGASKPFYVKFEDGTEGVWKKNVGWPASGPAETAAYKLDQELGTDLVGATVPRTFKGVPGTVQVRVTNLMKKSKEDNPDELSLFDYLIGNRDRHYNNYLQNNSGQLVAIDHGLAFSSESTTNGLLFFNNKVDSLKTRINKRTALEAKLEQVKATPNSKAEIEDLNQQITKLKLQESQLQSAISIAMPDKKVIDKLRQTKLARWREVFGNDLSDKQIKALYKRQQELLRSVDRAEKEIGPELLYREGPMSPVMSTRPAQSGYPFGNVPLFGRPK